MKRILIVELESEMFLVSATAFYHRNQFVGTAEKTAHLFSPWRHFQPTPENMGDD